MSGIVEGLIISKRGEESKTWMLIYVSGLLSAGAVIPSLLPAAFGSSSSASPPMVYNLPTIAVAALLTGFGTRLAKGCTSGHGICGIPRLSIRSLTAVLTFMATGAITAAVSRNTELKNRLMTGGELASFAADEDKTFLSSMVSNYLPTVATLVTTAALLNESFFLHSLFFPSKADAKAPASPDISFHDGLITYACGLLFGLGMGVSGMTNPERVVGFLNVGGASGWDPTLLGVMGGGVLFNLISFRIMHAYHHTIPLSSTRRSISQTIKVLLGAKSLHSSCFI